MTKSSLLEKFVEAQPTRTLTGLNRALVVCFTFVGITAAVINVFHIVIAGQVMLQMAGVAFLLAMFLPGVFLYYAANPKASSKVPWYDYVFALLAFIGPLYVVIFARTIIWSGWVYKGPVLSLVLGIITWILIVEGTRRTAGMILAGLMILFSIYPFFAVWCPGIFFGKSYSVLRLTSFYFLGVDGIWGVVMACLGRIFIGFILFGCALQWAGGGRFFLQFAMSSLGWMRGGAAKASVIASALFGTLSGSSFSNTVTTGTITIPAMKDSGYEPHYACAVEAAASTGGIVMPPVMGLVAFLMADFIGVSYAKVLFAASMPAVLYYFALFMQSDYYAAKNGIAGLPRTELPKFSKVMKEGWYYVFALLALIIFIFVFKWEARSPFFATLVLLATVGIKDLMNKEATLAGFFKKLTNLLDQTGQILIGLAPILAGIGLMIGGLNITGFTHGFTLVITEIAGDNLYILLVLAAIAGYVMGMGITISAIYIFLAMLVAPALIKIGINPFAAHLFLIYWALVAEISPPVALTALVASKVGGASYLKTSVQSVRLGMVLLFLPFVFVLQPALVGQGSPLQMIVSFTTAALAIALFSSASEGYMPKFKLISPLVRVVAVISGVFLLFPDYQSKLIGLLIFVVLIIVMVAVRGKERLASRAFD